MKSCFESLLIALSMYSTLPVKCLNWNAKNLRLAMLFFPIVGLLCGGGLWLVWTVCQLLHRSAYLFAVLAVLVNVWITGGIHLDGFCDTADALYSRRPMEEKLRILKDPNCGPFAVFAVILVLLVQVAAYAQIYTEQNRVIIGHILHPIPASWQNNIVDERTGQRQAVRQDWTFRYSLRRKLKSASGVPPLLIPVALLRKSLCSFWTGWKIPVRKSG